MVYIHGLGESGLCFEKLMVDGRIGAWSHVCPDLIGYGKSPWAAEPLTLVQHAGEIARWLEHVAPDRGVDLVGHSMGGVVGLLLCEQRPDLVRRFINVEGNISPDDCAFSSQAAGFDRRDFCDHGMQRLLAAIHADSSQRAMREYFVSACICDPRAYHLNSTELVALSKREGLARRLGALRIPVLYVYGEPHGTGARSRTLLENAGVRCHAVPDAGHWPFIDGQPAFVDALASFLEEP